MIVRHILRDGRVLDDLEGYVVKYEDATSIYELMKRINETENKKITGGSK